MTSATDDLACIVFDLGSKIAKISIASIKVEEVKDVISAYHDTWSNKIKLSPNPTSEHIILSGIDKASLIRIFDIQGRLMYETSYSPGNKIDIRDLNVGTYLVRVMGENGFGVKKFLKE